MWLLYFREFQDKMKVFAQFHTLSEHETLLENVQSEWLLKACVHNDITI